MIANHIIVDRDEHGAPCLRIDDLVFDFAIANRGITVPAPSLDETPTVTVTFLAEKVTMINDLDNIVRSAGPPYRCGHRGCLGHHDTMHESCC